MLGGQGAVGRDRGRGWVVRPCRGQRWEASGAGIRTGKDGRVEQEGLGKGTVCKRWPLFEGLDQASSDLSGTSDETVVIIITKHHCNRRQ